MFSIAISQYDYIWLSKHHEHIRCFIPHVASSRNPHDILFFLSKQEQAGYSAIFLCKAEAGLIGPVLKQLYNVIWLLVV